MNKTLFALALAALMAAPATVSAEECDRPDAIDIAGVAYIDDRSGGEITIDHWVYLEGNGKAGLQAGGAGESAEYAGCDNPDILVI